MVKNGVGGLSYRGQKQDGARGVVGSVLADWLADKFKVP